MTTEHFAWEGCLYETSESEDLPALRLKAYLTNAATRTGRRIQGIT